MGAIFPAGPPAKPDYDALRSGFSTFGRMWLYSGGTNASPAAGELYLGYFTAEKTITCSFFQFEVTTPRAGGTITYAAAGFFAANRATGATSGAGWMSPSPTTALTIFDTATTVVVTPGSSFTFTAGSEYAFALLGVGSGWTTNPIVAGSRNSGTNAPTLRDPFLMARKTGQTTMAATTATGLLGAAGRPYAECYP